MYTHHLVGYWDLSTVGTVPNLAPRTYGSNDGTTEGGLLSSDIVDGIGGGKALSFDGIVDYVTMGDITSLDGEPEWSVSIWAKPADIIAQNAIIAKWNTPTPPTITTCFLVDIFANDIRSFVGKGGTYSLNTFTITEVDKWYHIVTTKDSTTAYLYVNGELIDTKANSEAFRNNSEPLLIGAKSDGGVLTALYEGVIDEPKLFNKALTNLEVRDLYEKTRGGRI